MTSSEIAGAVELLWEERRRSGSDGGSGAVVGSNAGGRGENGTRIDLPMAAEILAGRGYASRSVDHEMKMYFRIFDGGNKGHVTLEDLRRVRGEVRAVEGEMGFSVGSESEESVSAGGVGEAALRAMIEQFDRNNDGKIDYDEFKSVMEPILSDSPSS